MKDEDIYETIINGVESTREDFLKNIDAKNKKFIDIVLILTLVIIMATLTLILLGLVLEKHQIVALIIFCFSVPFLMLLKLMLEI